MTSCSRVLAAVHSAAVNVGAHVAFLNYDRKTTYMQSPSRQMPGWMEHNLESRLLGELSVSSEVQMTPPLWQKVKALKSLLMEVEDESGKADLKPSIQKTKAMPSGPITSGK